MKSFPQIFKYCLVGVLNTAIDFMVLNGLLFIFNYSTTAYPFLKAVSFSAALANSYYFNRHWVFKDESTSAKQRVFFVAASVGGLIINAGVATCALYVFHASSAGWSIAATANISAIFGTAASLVWNYCFYKYGVFRQRHDR